MLRRRNPLRKQINSSISSPRRSSNTNNRLPRSSINNRRRPRRSRVTSSIPHSPAIPTRADTIRAQVRTLMRRTKATVKRFTRRNHPLPFLNTSSPPVPVMTTFGRPVRGRMRTVVIIGHRARGFWRRSLARFGRLLIGDSTVAATATTVAIGDRTSDFTAESTTGSVIPAGASTEATGGETRSAITGLSPTSTSRMFTMFITRTFKTSRPIGLATTAETVAYRYGLFRLNWRCRPSGVCPRCPRKSRKSGRRPRIVRTSRR